MQFVGKWRDRGQRTDPIRPVRISQLLLMNMHCPSSGADEREEEEEENDDDGSSSDGGTDEEKEKESDTEGDPQERMEEDYAEFVQLMQQRFLRGEDADFVDYNAVDKDDDLDWKQEDKDAEERWFDSDEEKEEQKEEVDAAQQDAKRKL